jgi:hypothetical protein
VRGSSSFPGSRLINQDDGRDESRPYTKIKAEPGPRPEDGQGDEKKERRRRYLCLLSNPESFFSAFFSYTVRWLKPPLPFCAGLSAKGNNPTLLLPLLSAPLCLEARFAPGVRFFMLLFLALVPGLLAGMTDAMNRAPTQTQKAEPGPRPEIAGVTKKESAP